MSRLKLASEHSPGTEETHDKFYDDRNLSEIRSGYLLNTTLGVLSQHQIIPMIYFEHWIVSYVGRENHRDYDGLDIQHGRGKQIIHIRNFGGVITSNQAILENGNKRKNNIKMYRTGWSILVSWR